MNLAIVIAVVLALVSTTLTNLAYLREHDAAAELPVLCLRRPLQSARLLLEDRSWMLGFAMESSGFLLYAAALALAPLTLVQSIGAGGIGILAFAIARFARGRLSGRERTAVILSVTGLVALAISLADGGDHGGGGDVVPILLWVGLTVGVAIVLVGFGRRLLGIAVADAVAGGLLFSIGDVSTKVATEGQARLGFIAALVVGYTGGTALLQRGYQAGGALTVAGIATLLTNALPIVAGTVVLDEPVPSGALGGIRLLAFAAVIAGAVLLARPEKPSETQARRAATTGDPTTAALGLGDTAADGK